MFPYVLDDIPRDERRIQARFRDSCATVIWPFRTYYARCSFAQHYGGEIRLVQRMGTEWQHFICSLARGALAKYTNFPKFIPQLAVLL